MAIIRGAYGGGQIKGSISGTTYQQSPFGTVARNRTVPVNPNTGKQVDIRGAMAGMSYIWTTLLTNAERQAWEDYAAATPIPDRFGTTIIVRGRQMFMRTNLIRFYITGSADITAPSTPGVAPNPVLDLSADTTDGLVINSNPGASAVGDICNIGLGVPVNFSRNFYKAPFTNVAGLTSTSTFPFTVLPNTALSIGQKYFLSSRLVLANNKVSSQVIGSVEVTA